MHWPVAVDPLATGFLLVASRKCRPGRNLSDSLGLTLLVSRPEPSRVWEKKVGSESPSLVGLRRAFVCGDPTRRTAAAISRSGAGPGHRQFYPFARSGGLSSRSSPACRSTGIVLFSSRSDHAQASTDRSMCSWKLTSALSALARRRFACSRFGSARGVIAPNRASSQRFRTNAR